MQSCIVRQYLYSLKSQDYRLAAERSTDSKNTTFIYPLNTDNEQRFMRVLAMVALAK